MATLFGVIATAVCVLLMIAVARDKLAARDHTGNSGDHSDTSA
jgi:hypothetical protein